MIKFFGQMGRINIFLTENAPKCVNAFFIREKKKYFSGHEWSCFVGVMSNQKCTFFQYKNGIYEA